MLLFEATHTSHTRAQTGIQRVVRSSFVELSQQLPTTGICYDPYLQSWRPLDVSELDHLRPGQMSTGSRSAKWPLGKKISGHVGRLLGRQSALPSSTGLIMPELFSAQVGTMLPSLFAAVKGPRVAVFHDAIGLKLPEMTPASTVTRLPSYLRELLQFDGIAAVSEDSASSLQDFWRWLEIPHTPPIAVIPLGTDPAPTLVPDTSPKTPRILSVGTIEGRKNHVSLLDACEVLWREGLKFELHLQGLARPDTAAAALNKIDTLQKAGRPLRYDGAVTDQALHEAYAACSFTVYPSLIEGFGLPVLESLRHGKPCICSAHGALGESTHEGGCLPIAATDSQSIANAIRELLENPAQVSRLTQTAKVRKFRTWSDYTDDLLNWMQTLPRRA